MYEDCHDKTLEELLIDKHGKKHTVSQPPGSMSQEHIKYLHELAARTLPAPLAEIISKTEQPFMQAVFDLQVPQFVNGAVCFMGDAASVLRPHSESGVLKALSDSLGLMQALNNDTIADLTALLKEWSGARVEAARKEVALAKNMGEGLVTKSPDWGAMDQAKMDEWWRAIMSGKSWYATTEHYLVSSQKWD